MSVEQDNSMPKGAGKYGVVDRNISEAKMSARYVEVEQPVDILGSKPGQVMKPVNIKFYGYHHTSSCSEQDGGLKHWVTKKFIGECEDKSVDATKEIDGDHVLFLKDAVVDSFLSRILSLINPRISKSKLVSERESVSRLYPLDGHNPKEGLDKGIITGSNLHSAMVEFWKKQDSSVRLDGMLQSIVFRIIIEDWDNKSQNYACHAKKGEKGIYEVAPFDLSYALQCMDSSKKWDLDEIQSIILGGDEGGPRIGVARALAETIDPFGTRTSDYYHKDRETRRVNDKNQIGFVAFSKKIVVASIDAELQAVIDKSEGDILTKSGALMSVFKESIAAMERVIDDKKNKGVSASRVDMAERRVAEDIAALDDEKLPLGGKQNDLRKHLDKCKGKLESSIDRFSEFLNDLGLVIDSQERKAHESKAKEAEGLMQVVSADSVTQNKSGGRGYTPSKEPTSLFNNNDVI